jgi:hypothetical protein
MLRFENNLILRLSFLTIRTILVFFFTLFETPDPATIIPGQLNFCRVIT